VLRPRAERDDEAVPVIGRRAWVGAAGALGLGALVGARARTRATPARVGLVFNAAPLSEMSGTDPSHPYARVFVRALRGLGYVEGRDVVIERRSAEGNRDRLPALMQELVALPVDVIVCVGPGAVAAAAATRTIPIVAQIDDPDGLGLTDALGRPTRNITGVTDSPDLSIHAKRLQLLKEAAPKSARVAVVDFKYVDSRVTPGTHRRRAAVEAAARDLRIALVPVGVEKEEDFDAAFASIERERADALIEMGIPITLAYRQRIIDFAAQRALPAVYTSREFADSGGLMAYGPNGPAGFGRLAETVDRILKGAKVADLPFEHPTQFDLVINLKTASSLRLALPSPLVLRATEVIR
jgi:putative ABC transport system substrate-binding protein